MLEIKVRNPGAELTSVKFNGKERLHDGKNFWDRQAPILFPTVGRLRDNKTVIEGKEYKIPQHGFEKDMDFELIEKTKNKEIYELKSNEETLKKYPFKFVLNIEYEFTEDILTTKIRVINKDDKNMIFGLGGHPGFKLEMPQEEYYFELEAEEPEVEFMEVEGNYISNKLAKNILKENKMDRDLSGIIKSTSYLREKSDYDDFYIASKNEAEEQLTNARLFLQKVEQYLKDMDVI